MVRHAVVVGAGVAGLTAGWRLAQAGWQVSIFEQQNCVGGLLAGPTVGGVNCDLGAHRLHPAALRVAAVADVARTAPLEPRQRKGKIVLRGQQLNYPLSPLGLMRGLGLADGLRFAADFLRAPRWQAHGRADTDVGFAQFVQQRAGLAAYTAFYEPYARKVWGLDPAELSQTCAKQRLSTAAPWQALTASAQRQQFWVPRGGFAMFVEQLRSKCVGLGVSLHVATPVPAAAVQAADAVLDSGHLQRHAPGLLCDHKGLHLLWLQVEGPALADVDTWYCPEPQFAFGRVTQVSHFCPPQPDLPRLLCVEIPQGSLGDSVQWAAHIPLLSAQLRQAGIVAACNHLRLMQQHFLPRVYPLHRRGWRATWQAAMAAAVADGKTLPIGRQGLWLHCNLDQAMHTAELAVAQVVAGQPAALWPEIAKQFLQLQVRD